MSELAKLAPVGVSVTTWWIVIGLAVALLVIGLVIYISYRSTLDEDSRHTE